MNEQIERRIEELLTLEGLGAEALSWFLFGPDGLFGKLAGDVDERVVLARSPLFHRANERLMELQRRELIAIRNARVSERLAEQVNGRGPKLS
jgi:hypothetical protein